MRVKIGDTWHEVGPNSPIMVHLSRGDKMNLRHMPDDKFYYACFHEHDPLSRDERLEWMEDPSKVY